VTATARPGRTRSRAVATWLALIAGTLGAHRFYLHGVRDPLAWLHLPPTLVGAYGWWRMRQFGVDDALGSLLVLCLGAVVAAAMLQAIVYGLTSDARWAARHGPQPAPRSAWPVVIAVVLAVAIGAAATMATIALAAQRYFESRAALR
jgi:TM2 domain-containing membrane protein YozV